MSDTDADLARSDDPRVLLTVAGRRAGVSTAEATLIRDGTNVIYETSGGVVARVGPPGSQSVAARQMQASRWLAGAGIPVVRAIDEIDQPTVVGNRPVTWWVKLPDHRHATPAEVGAVLGRLHALATPESPAFPVVDPFDGLNESITGGDALPVDDRTWLRHLADRLRVEYAALLPGLSPCVIHGDAWQGNVVVPRSGGVPVLLDLDHVGIGPREWDLVSLAVDHTDFARITDAEYHAFVDAYGGYDMIGWPGYRTLATIRELWWTAFVLGKPPPAEKLAERHGTGWHACVARSDDLGRGQRSELSRDVPPPWPDVGVGPTLREIVVRRAEPRAGVVRDGNRADQGICTGSLVGRRDSRCDRSRMGVSWAAWLGSRAARPGPVVAGTGSSFSEHPHVPSCARSCCVVLAIGH